MKSLNVKISLAGMTSCLLVGASLLGFSSVLPMAAASSSIDDTNTTTAEDSGGATATTLSDNMSLNATDSANSSTTTGTIELSEQPVAVGNYRTVSNNMTNETQAQFTFEGNTTITLQNSTEEVTTRDTGEGTFSILPGERGGSIRGQIHMTTEDGSESATANFTEFIKLESSTGIGTAYFSTSSTENLGRLNNMIAVFLDEQQPNGDSIVRFFEWKSDGGAPIGNGNVTTIGGGNDTTTATANTEIPNVSIP